MPQTPHIERHFTAGHVVRDIVIGMSDGLTVPFALAAGLSGAVDSTSLIVIAGFAEIAAGSIAMGVGGYLAAKNDVEHYNRERARENIEIGQKPREEAAEVVAVLQEYGLSHNESTAVAEALSQRPEAWVDFMMRFELGLERPDPRRVFTSAFTIGGSYIIGGLIPLAPYIILSNARTAFIASIAVTLCALAAFGFIKARFTGARPLKSAVRTTLIGGLAAAAAFFIARAVS
ncbi:MAG: iron transporter [Blastocatellia bacterium AA13]|nr:MAG: iron transporter [Blastocatellia bacterium AA13]